ncbi:GTPase family protein [Altericista sp. CCNU0014]|uniref:GTPase family protein n=1 Tax=Altericista sp. CCNU0014 TaxID=3082949 RepID=UPI00384F6D20
MIRLTPLQWIVLALPFAIVVGFLLVAAGQQIHQWHLNWIWAVIALLFLGWRFLLVRWLRPPALAAAEAALAELNETPDLSTLPPDSKAAARQQAEAKIQQTLQAAQADGPPWENWGLFFQHCQQLVEAIALLYHPQSKRPLLNIYVPQAYSLIRGTVDDVDQWMQKLSPILGQVTIGQAFEAYETYQKLEPAARLALKAWNWAQWVFNPLVALARTATQGYSAQANQQLVMNLGQLLRETTLKALGERAIALYSGETLQPLTLSEAPPEPQTQTLRDLFARAAATTQQSVQTQPVNLLLVGRTGAGKSNAINTLFQQELAQVDVLPSTDRIQSYTYETPIGETLILWDTPGYEQIAQAQYAQDVLDKAAAADLVLLATPANDPTLQMDLDLLSQIRQHNPALPILTAVTQVDRLRPLREWEPPYNWQTGDRPKEKNIREAVRYRAELLQPFSAIALPLATEDIAQGRVAWGVSELSQAILNAVEPAKQLRLSRFLRDLDTRTQTAAALIDRYAFQIGTTQGLTALIKSPILKFLSTILTGSPALAIVLAEKLPLEQSPVVLGKLQMAYELYALLSPPAVALSTEIPILWPLMLTSSASVSQEVWALGHTLIERWIGNNLTPSSDRPTPSIPERYTFYLQQAQNHRDRT